MFRILGFFFLVKINFRGRGWLLGHADSLGEWPSCGPVNWKALPTDLLTIWWLQVSAAMSLFFWRLNVWLFISGFGPVNWKQSWDNFERCEWDNQPQSPFVLKRGLDSWWEDVIIRLPLYLSQNRGLCNSSFVGVWPLGFFPLILHLDEWPLLDLLC